MSKAMDRRRFLELAAKGTLGAAALGALTACGQQAAEETSKKAEELQQEVAKDKALPELNWEIATSWPPGLDTIFGGAQVFAERVTAMTGGKFQMKARAAGELAPGLEVLNVVEAGSVPIGHTASYYYIGKSPVCAFGTTLPFGLTARQQNAWFYEGGGGKLLQEFYMERFGVIQFLAGNTGVQMGGWFNKEINSLKDLKGLKMRIPGLGGEVLKRAGGTPVNLPGGELYTSLQSGAIDATEWVGPYNDLAFGLYKAAKYYYYPGWHEPGTTLEAIINQKALAALPKDLQTIVLNACKVVNQDMLAEYTARNNAALHTLITKHKVELRQFPDDVLKKLRQLSDEVVAEIAAKDKFTSKVYRSFKQFRDEAMAWHRISEQAYLRAREM